VLRALSAITGIGSSNVVNIAVDENAQMDIADLRKALETSLTKKQAVYAVVAVIGSTEEGAVDPLDKIIELQKFFQARGLSFVVHAGAASPHAAVFEFCADPQIRCRLGWVLCVHDQRQTPT
jgi:glutamate/tyrosine decarboxylase-like PLP-dependent enzyme